MNLYQVGNRETITLFPTLLHKLKLQDKNLLDQFEKKIYDLREQKQGFEKRGVFTANDTLHLEPEMAPLCDIIMQESDRILNDLKVVRDSHYITHMWAHVTPPNHRHMMHTHSNSFLSGTLYVKTPKKCAPVIFSDPRPGVPILVPEYTEYNRANGATFQIYPQRGDLLIFPSWLPHGVDEGECEAHEERISIPFNIMLKGKINSRPTETLTL